MARQLAKDSPFLALELISSALLAQFKRQAIFSTLMMALGFPDVGFLSLRQDGKGTATMD